MGRMVYKLAEQLIPRMNGRSCNHFCTCGSSPSTVRVFQQALTVESNSWTTPLVLRLPSSGNVSARYCWNGSILVASFSHIVIIVRLTLISDRWPPLRALLRGATCVRSRPAHVQAHCRTSWLIDLLSNRTGQLIDPLSDCAPPTGIGPTG